MINLSHVSKKYSPRQNWVVDDVSLSIEKGETVVLLGASGCGKTTLLKMINRLIEPTSGNIKINGQDCTLMPPIELRRSIGYVFQGVGLFPHMTIAENIAVPLQLKGIKTDDRSQRINELLELVNLDPSRFSQRYPHQLSGGQRQRIGVARALSHKPHILLMDEPFGALDPVNRNSLQQELITIKTKLHQTILFVTHDIFEAFTLGDRIAILNQGKIEQIGTKNELIHSPKTDYVKQWVAHITEQAETLIDHIQ